MWRFIAKPCCDGHLDGLLLLILAIKQYIIHHFIKKNSSSLLYIISSLFIFHQTSPISPLFIIKNPILIH